jgi:DNA-binding NarL/FixJ family response regulator
MDDRVSSGLFDRSQSVIMGAFDNPVVPINQPRGDRPKRVIVAGASTLLVEALAAALAVYPGIESPRSAATSAELLEKSRARRPDVVVVCSVDLDLAAIRMIRDLHQTVPSARALVVTERPSPRDRQHTAEAGAAACLSLEAGLWGLIRAIEEEHNEAVLDAAPLAPAQEVETSLTRRECQVLGLLAEGISPAVIASRLAISVYTARGHVKKVLRKLGAHTQLEAVAVARRLGILERRNP